MEVLADFRNFNDVGVFKNIEAPPKGEWKKGENHLSYESTTEYDHEVSGTHFRGFFSSTTTVCDTTITTVSIGVRGNIAKMIAMWTVEDLGYGNGCNITLELEIEPIFYLKTLAFWFNALPSKIRNAQADKFAAEVQTMINTKALAHIEQIRAAA